MRWLEQALRRTQRRFRLHQILLLILRTLLVLLAVLAASRPLLVGWGRGGDVVLIIDTSMSMGPCEAGPGALARCRQALQDAPLHYEHLVLVAVGREVQILADGEPEQTRQALERLQADDHAGGLDDVLERATQLRTLIGLCRPESRIILVSDFRQDDGSSLSAALQQQVQSVQWWRVGDVHRNTALRQLPTLPDMVAHQAEHLDLQITPTPSTLLMGLDGGAPAPLPPATDEGYRISLPPLAAGVHQIQLRWRHDGLSHHQQLQLPLVVRDPFPVLVVDERNPAPLALALRAAHEHLQVRICHPAQLPDEALPERGLVVLHSPITDATRLHEWLLAGGVLWSDLSILTQCPPLSELVEISPDRRPGGALQAPGSALSAALSRYQVPDCIALTKQPDASDVLLRAGNAPLLIQQAVGPGLLLAETAPLSSNTEFWLQVAAGLWAREQIRTVLRPRWQSLALFQGDPSPRHLELQRQSERQQLPAGAAVDLPPGTWEQLADPQPVVILPDPQELDLQQDPQREGSQAQALPPSQGREWGLPLAIAALLILLLEGALAAHLSRRYAQPLGATGHG